jgi:hypothetical protein
VYPFVSGRLYTWPEIKFFRLQTYGEDAWLPAGVVIELFLRNGDGGIAFTKVPWDN